MECKHPAPTLTIHRIRPTFKHPEGGYEFVCRKCKKRWTKWG